MEENLNDVSPRREFEHLVAGKNDPKLLPSFDVRQFEAAVGIGENDQPSLDDLNGCSGNRGTVFCV